jgi:metal-responsive CopG/Arc/MetJ family transcriptional regulator
MDDMHRIGINLPKSWNVQLKPILTREGLSLSGLVRKLLWEYIQKEGEK